MGAFAGPDVVEDGLVLALDAGNTKSYPGYWSPTLSNGANAFDGSLSTAAGTLGGTFGPFTYTFANPPAINSARMFVTFGAGSNQVGSRTNVFLVNGIDVTQKAKDANVFGDGVGSAWIDVTAEAGSNWNTFQFTGTGGSTNPGIYAIEINGKIIVGNYNGTTWTDLSGNGNNGTLQNGVGYNSNNGGSLTFDGVDEYVNAGLLNFSGSFSLSCWMKANSGTSSIYTKGLINRYSTQGSYRQYLLGFNESANYLNFGISTDGSGTGGSGNFVQSPNNSINRDTWYHIAGAFTSGSKVEIFINGELSNSVNTSATSHFQSNVKPLEIGAAEASDGITTRVFNGNIAQASIYNRALTASEIQQNFNALRGRFGI